MTPKASQTSTTKSEKPNPTRRANKALQGRSTMLQNSTKTIKKVILRVTNQIQANKLQEAIKLMRRVTSYRQSQIATRTKKSKINYLSPTLKSRCQLQTQFKNMQKRKEKLMVETLLLSDWSCIFFQIFTDLTYTITSY